MTRDELRGTLARSIWLAGAISADKERVWDTMLDFDREHAYREADAVLSAIHEAGCAVVERPMAHVVMVPDSSHSGMFAAVDTVSAWVSASDLSAPKDSA